MDVPMIELGEALFSTEDAAEVEEPCMTSQRSIYDQQKAFNPNIGSDVFFSSAAQLTPQDFIPEMSRPLTTPPPLIETEPLPSSELIPVPSISTFRSEMDFHGNQQLGGYQATSAFKLMPGVKRKVSGNSSIFTMSTHHYEPSPKTFKPSNQFEKKITNFIKRVSSTNGRETPQITPSQPYPSHQTMGVHPSFSCYGGYGGFGATVCTVCGDAARWQHYG